jgi:hypothetical protein
MAQIKTTRITELFREGKKIDAAVRRAVRKAVFGTARAPRGRRGGQRSGGGRRDGR